MRFCPRVLIVEDEAAISDILSEVLSEDYEVSRPAESHRQALAEPDVRLPPHPAPIVQPYPCSSRQ
jgi:DNA-binding NtrC family response regulator